MKRLSQLFKKENKIKKGIIKSEFIYQNNNIDIVHRACKICHGTGLEEDEGSKIKYISRIMGYGHESTLEHSNVITVITVPRDKYDELLEVMAVSRYAFTKVRHTKNGAALLIGGSIRAYKNIIRDIDNQDNTVAEEILNNMYYTSPCYFDDFIKDGIMDRSNFDFEPYSVYKFDSITSDRLDVINVDPINYIYEKIKKYGFSWEDALEVCTTTILVKDLSRVISQQLTRHRNAISQASQRYIDYSEVGFNAPYVYKDKYNKDDKYQISLTIDGKDYSGNYTQDELANMWSTVYKQLRDQGMDKEDARAYMLNNVFTSLYITMPDKNLIHFLNLRTKPSAQAEIRKAIAIPLKEIMDSYIPNMFDFLVPKYKRIQQGIVVYGQNDVNEEIDEILSEKEFTEEITNKSREIGQPKDIVVEEGYQQKTSLKGVIDEDEDGNLKYNKEDYI